MEPILTKDEINDLLAAVKQGEISTEEIPEQKKPGSGLVSGKAAEKVDLFKLYMQHDSSQRIPNFDITLDNFAQNFGISLTNQLQRTYVVSRSSIETKQFQEVLVDFNNQGAIGILSIDPLKHGCLLHFDSLLAFVLLEAMLGATVDSDSLALDRTLTTIEINILKNIMDGTCSDLQRAFRPFVELEASLIKVENNFRLVSIVEPETEMLVAKFKVTVGDHTGNLTLAIPYISLEPIREKLKDLMAVTSSKNSWASIIEKQLLSMGNTVTARSGIFHLTIKDILALKPGQILDPGYNPNQPVTVLVEGKPKFMAQPGERDGKKAIHITEIINA